jgi:gamma-glutamylaminecyclotransferase
MMIFVYGSLLSGEANHAHLGSSRSLGPARTHPSYTLVDLGPYPALLDEGTTAVVGELYDVDDATRAALDEFEGHPTYYRRGAVRIASHEGLDVEAYFLLGGAAGALAIPGGDWRRR